MKKLFILAVIILAMINMLQAQDWYKPEENKIVVSNIKVKSPILTNLKFVKYESKIINDSSRRQAAVKRTKQIKQTNEVYYPFYDNYILNSMNMYPRREQKIIIYRLGEQRSY